MKKALKRAYNSGVFHSVDGKRIAGVPESISGNISSDLYGDISGLYGDISGLSGDFDDCEITEEERKNGVKINDLIGD